MKQLAILFLNLYKRIISPVLVLNFGHACRFTPTCGEYTKEAIGRFGLFKGGVISLVRIIKCNPLGGQGYDPLPS